MGGKAARFTAPLLLGRKDVVDKNIPSISPGFVCETKNKYVAEIYVPATTATSISMTAGTIFVDGLTGPLHAELLLGEIQGYYRGSHLTAKLGAGDIKLHGLTGSAQASLGAGDLELSWVDLPPQSEVKIKCHLGDVALQFKEEAKAAMSLEMGWPKTYRIQNLAMAQVEVRSTFADVHLLSSTLSKGGQS